MVWLSSGGVCGHACTAENMIYESRVNFLKILSIFPTKRYRQNWDICVFWECEEYIYIFGFWIVYVKKYA